MVPALVLFDGVCNLCNASVNFLIDRDPAGHFQFASLQSQVGRALVASHGLDPDALSSLVLIENGRAYTESEGALRIAARLPLPWSLARAFLGVPCPLRDPVYRWIARHRYRWFGQRDACRLPTPAERARFLVDEDPQPAGR